jgi:mRNA interferase MazF
MILTTVRDIAPVRGDVWSVRFDPGEGDEIKKIRPAVVMTATGAGRMRLHIVVPITSWQPHLARYFWMIRLVPTSANGLANESGADAFQVKSLSISRFQRQIGILDTKQLDEIATAIALCIGYKS